MCFIRLRDVVGMKERWKGAGKAHGKFRGCGYAEVAQQKDTASVSCEAGATRGGEGVLRGLSRLGIDAGESFRAGAAESQPPVQGFGLPSEMEAEGSHKGWIWCFHFAAPELDMCMVNVPI